MNAENIENNGCSQRDSAEHEGYAKTHRSFNSIWKERNSAQPELLEKILYKDNLNRACELLGIKIPSFLLRRYNLASITHTCQRLWTPQA